MYHLNLAFYQFYGVFYSGVDGFSMGFPKLVHAKSWKKKKTL